MLVWRMALEHMADGLERIFELMKKKIISVCLRFTFHILVIRVDGLKLKR